eukprot:TRINITY_DN8535_c0_g1_i1.p1 TRINITY_DN8535_c0_g1~~TRINITY_DN8535_c0_g1_i1.p1  ORF type:complete len:508 (-),score=66.93 TRINITY_DN8535_c0_g1_i1:15-1538(-)
MISLENNNSNSSSIDLLDLSESTLSLELEDGRLPQQESTPKIVFFHAFFIVIASVLGSGILGLPVKLAKSGFTPFLLTYTICFFLQALVIVLAIETLLRARLAKGNVNGAIHILMDEFGTADEFNKEEQEQQNEMDLHTMGKMYLPKPLMILFDCAVMLHFISILISYSLAGSEAYASLIPGFDIPLVIVIPIFSVSLTLLIIFGKNYISYIISSLTMAKGSLLGALVCVTALVSLSVGESSINNFSYTGRTFLIGTVALGGAINTIPIIFSKVKNNARDIKLFMLSSVGGLFFVWLLNVLWCYFILGVVPQVSGDISLLNAQRNGSISTVPLIEIIRRDHPQFGWAAYTVDIFIIVSITVSYITLGTGMRHVLDGFALGLRGDAGNTNEIIGKIKQFFYSLSHFKKRGVMYLFFFGIVLLIAMLNPNGFLLTIEKATSLALNLESGFFIGYMIHKARESTIPIPFELPAIVYNCRYLVMAYFLFAVAYDLVSIVVEIVAPSIASYI